MNDLTPLVSVGVPIFNEGKHIRQTLASLVSQDYANIEIIISDNCSTDETSWICREFAAQDGRIRYSRFDENRGAFTNFCSVLGDAAGKYFMWAAGHDLWSPELISRCVSTMERDPEIAICYGRGVRIDNEDKVLGLAPNSMDLRGMSPAERLDQLVNNISGGDIVYGLMRLDLLKNLELKMGWGQDQVILAELALKGSIAHIAEPMFFWRQKACEDIEYRRNTVPGTLDPVKGQRMLSLSMPELWRQMGDGTIAAITRSDLSPQEKKVLKEKVRQCFTKRYGVQWNEVVPSELKNEGKNILLTTSAAPDQTPFSTSEKRPPIGVGFLISTLREAGHNVFFVDNYLSPSNFLGTDYLIRHQIDFVGIYTNTICFRDSLKMFYRLEELRQRGLWNGKIIAGGPHASVNPETIPPFVDHVVIGEGEFAIRDIVAGTVRERLVRYPAIENLDELPMPAWDYFADMPYEWGGNWFSDSPVFTMNTSRGCPFSCTFCSVHAIWGKRYTAMGAERIVADIEHLITTYGARGIYFREDNFTLDKKRLTRFCELMLERRIEIPWVCETRVDSLDESTVELMARAGAKGFYIGVESGSQRILDFMKKGISVEQIKKAFQLARRHGILTAASIIVGLPTETEQDLKETSVLLEEISPDVTWFNVFVGMPDSPMYRHAIDNKLYEFIDDRGLVYIKGHDKKISLLYNDAWDAGCPVRIENGMIAEPSISVVMSVYNMEKFLEKAIRSILGQTFPDFEFIIVDDSSTDESAAIIASFNDPRIRVITNASNIGLTRSLNKAITASRAPLIARMDADDYCSPHRLEEQYKFMSEHSDIGLVGSSYYVVDERNTTLSITHVLTEHEQLYHGLEQQNWFGHGTVMFRRSVFCAVGGYDEFFTYAQDYDLWLRISESTRVANIAETLYHWRKTTSGISLEKANEQTQFAKLARENALTRRQGSTAPLPLVSVILPTFNRPELLAKALQSIMTQTFRDYEVIVINDAGVDVAPLVNHFNNTGNFRYINKETNQGLAAARNTGIRAAKGKYLAYLDDDDVFYPDHLETLVNFLEGNQYRVAYTNAYRAIQEKNGDTYTTVQKDNPYDDDYDADRLLVENYIPVLCVMHERKCLDQAGLFDESLPRHEDWDLWIRLSQRYPFGHIRKTTAEFTYRTTDPSGMTSGTLPSMLITLEKIYEKTALLADSRPMVAARRKSYLFDLKNRIHHFLRKHVDALIETMDGSHLPTESDALEQLGRTGASNSQILAAYHHTLGLRCKDDDVISSLSHFSHALVADSACCPVHSSVAEILLQIGEFEKASRHCEAILSQEPNDPELLGMMAAIAQRLGNEGEASSWEQKARKAKQEMAAA